MPKRCPAIHCRLRPSRFGRLGPYVRCSLVAGREPAPRSAPGVRRATNPCPPADSPRTARSRSALDCGTSLTLPAALLALVLLGEPLLQRREVLEDRVRVHLALA